MNIADFITRLLLKSPGRKAAREKATNASILLRVAAVFFAFFCGLLWLYYHFM